MPGAIDRRVRRLERQAAVASFDPAEVCRRAHDCYMAGEPLPAILDRRERELAEAMYDFLWRSEPGRWWSNEPLPLPSVDAPDSTS